MSDIIHIYVASDARMGKAELAFAHSVKTHCSKPFEIHWMRAVPGCSDWGECWNRGRPLGKPHSGLWATDFTNFRWAVAELTGFEGRVLYNDVDQVYLADPVRLWELGGGLAWMSAGGKTDVAVINAKKLKGKDWWPTIAQMKKSGWRLGDYVSLLQRQQAFAAVLPGTWDCLDGRAMGPKTNLLHFTNMRTQPWKPWKEAFSYPAHPSPEAVKIFWRYHDGATRLERERTATHRSEETPPVVGVSER